MNIEEIREYALSLDHATERCPFGPDTLSIEIGGKMFCLMDLSGESRFYNLKVDPELSITLRDRYTCIRPAYHMNKKHWVSVDYDNPMPASMEKRLITHAYFQTAKGLTLKLRKELGIPMDVPQVM